VRWPVLFPIVIAFAGCSPQQPLPAASPAGREAGANVAGRVEVGGVTVNLPDEVTGEWRRSSKARRITADAIFDYMDGAGEMYLAYRFDHLDVHEYTSPDASLGTILVELYVMKSALDAFGLLSTDWTGEPVDLGALPGPASGLRIESVPRHHALFGAGLLRLFTGGLYARILASRDSPGTRSAVLAIGRALAGGREALPPPFLNSLPLRTAGAPRAGGNPTPSPIRADRTCFFRSHLVLNSQYFLASEDILGLGPEVAAATTEYAPARQGARPLRLIVARYPAPAAAAAAAETFRRAYLPGAPAGREDRGAAKTPHGWVAWAVEGSGLAIALDAADASAAAALVSRAAHAAGN
jgi:hypothetical protein